MKLKSWIDSASWNIEQILVIFLRDIFYRYLTMQWCTAAVRTSDLIISAKVTCSAVITCLKHAVLVLAIELCFNLQIKVRASAVYSISCKIISIIFSWNLCVFEHTDERPFYMSTNGTPISSRGRVDVGARITRHSWLKTSGSPNHEIGV